jgi:serine protease Do
MGASGSGLFDMEGKLIGINTFKTPGRRAYFYSLPIEWIASVEKQPFETTFPIQGRTFWEAEDKDKPFFMQVALPKLEEDWVKLSYVAADWVKAEPNNVEAWYELGQANEHLHKLEAAETAYQEVIKREPNHMEVLFSLGSIAKLKGDASQMHTLNITVTEIDETLGMQFSKMLGCETSC